VRKLAYFADKDGMNIDGLSEKRIEQLVDAGIVANFLDLYNLDSQKEKIVALEGMGEKSYEKLIEAIEKSRDVELENFITALGIPNVALSKAKVISRRFNGDWYAFENAVKEGFDFTELESIGDEIARCINDYFNSYFWHNSFLSLLVALMRFRPKEKEDGRSLEGLVFAITGDLNVYGNRRELQKEIESLGGKVAGSVSKKTSYLINNDPASPSSKNKSAIKNNVQIITEMDFINMIKGEKET
jgi:DNA ligase (NAD+)